MSRDVIGYFALYIIGNLSHDEFEQIILAVIASHVLFIPAGLIGLYIKHMSNNDKAKMYEYHEWRAYALLSVLSFIAVYEIDIPETIIYLVIFFVTLISDLIIGRIYYILKMKNV